MLGQLGLFDYRDVVSALGISSGVSELFWKAKSVRCSAYELTLGHFRVSLSGRVVIAFQEWVGLIP